MRIFTNVGKGERVWTSSRKSPVAHQDRGCIPLPVEGADCRQIYRATIETGPGKLLKRVDEELGYLDGLTKEAQFEKQRSRWTEIWVGLLGNTEQKRPRSFSTPELVARNSPIRFEEHGIGTLGAVTAIARARAVGPANSPLEYRPKCSAQNISAHLDR
jgi:hypothetical protein